MAQLSVHPDLAELAFLLGTWRGDGEGIWPPGETFRYGEEMSFEDVGLDAIVYTQRSWELPDGDAIHLERGFVRAGGPGRVEFTLAHPLGIAEVSEGTVVGSTIEVASSSVALTSTGSAVTELRRRLEVRDGALTCELHMAMHGTELTWHVRSRLEPV